MNASRRIQLAVALSLLAHALLLVLPSPTPEFTPPGPVASAPLDVRIVPRDSPPPVEAAAPPPPTPPAPAPRAPRPRVMTKPSPRPQLPAPPPPAPPAAPAPRPVPTPRPVPEPPPLDFMAALDAKRAARRAAEASRTPPAVQKAPEDAATRNLRTLTGREGVGGVFEILRKGTRTGEFAFNGWKPDARSQWREVIEVDAGLGGDIERAMVRRMIELIRTHYKGDFNWESHRLDRVVKLSARPEDQSGLEDFMMKEFFGDPRFSYRR